MEIGTEKLKESGAMSELSVISLTKADLDRIPTDERFFYLMAGHLGNDVNVLGKLLMAAYNSGFSPEDSKRREGPHGHAGLTQTFLLLKLLAGRLHEANVLIGAHYFGKGLPAKYEGEMHEKEIDARRQFSAYFSGRSNIITPVRNWFAFHHTRENIEPIYDAIADDFPFIQYLGEYTGHNLFFGNEMILLNAMAATVPGAATALDAIDIIYGDTVNTSAWLGLFVIGFIRVMIKRYINPIKRGQVNDIVIEDPSISRYTLPFFAGPPEGTA
jgi:hypothetical protein